MKLTPKNRKIAAVAIFAFIVAIVTQHVLIPTTGSQDPNIGLLLLAGLSWIVFWMCAILILRDRIRK